MRVVWITHNYPRHQGDISGGFLHPLAIALRDRGIDVRVVAPSDAGQGGHDALDGVPVNRVRYGTAAEERLAYGGTMASALRSPASLLTFNRLRVALRAGAQQEIDDAPGDVVIHAHWWVPGGWAAPASAPLVLTCHGTDVRLLDRVPFAALVARPVFRRARVVTTVSRRLGEIVRRRVGIAVADEDVQPMPAVPAERPWSDGSGDVVVVGRLSRQKRVHLAIEAAAIARSHGMTQRLAIIGDGPERHRLERQAMDLGVADAVRFVGAIPPAGVPAILATAAGCLMPARNEGFGLAAAEALMQGVPVVACHDGGGLGEIVPGTGAGRVVAADAGSIANALLDLLRDAGSREAARLAGAQWRQRLSPVFVADRCIAWYQRALRA